MTTAQTTALAHTAARRTTTGTARPVPRWVDRMAHLTAWTTVPSGIWRILVGFGATMGMPAAWLAASHMPGWGTLYVIGLSVAAESAALLTLGLVRGWGEVFPRWMPVLGGRRVPISFAVTLATLGVVALVWLWSPLVQFAPVLWGGSADVMGIADGWDVLMAACYLPLLLWGPMLAVVTAAYWWRRRQERTPR